MVHPARVKSLHLALDEHRYLLLLLTENGVPFL
jgi:hypothetical protein